MPIGIQEIAALLIVAIIIGFGLYRRWRRTRKRAAGCNGCADGPADETDEKPIHIYRRRD